MKKIAVKTIYMEMKNQTENRKYSFDDNVKIEKVKNLNLDFYKKIFKLIGEKWGWTGRLVLSENELKMKLEKAIIYILYYKNEIAGFIEFEKDKNDLEIIYFGLSHDYIGKGLGKNFLNYSIKKVWSEEKFERLWLHTCEYDHPRAVKVYKSVGFEIYKEKIDYEFYPESFI